MNVSLAAPPLAAAPLRRGPRAATLTLLLALASASFLVFGGAAVDSAATAPSDDLRIVLEQPCTLALCALR